MKKVSSKLQFIKLVTNSNLLLFGLLQMFAPSRVSSFELRILKQPLVISQDLKSPPAIAFETVFKKIKVPAAQPAVAAEQVAVISDKSWIVDFVLHDKGSQRIELPEMQISRSEFDTPAPAPEKQTSLVAQAMPPEPQVEPSDEWLSQLSGPQRRRVELAGRQTGGVDFSVNAGPSLAEKIEALSAENPILPAPTVTGVTKRIPTSTGGVIIVTRNEPPPHEPAAKPNAEPTPNPSNAMTLADYQGTPSAETSQLVRSLASFRNITFTGPVEISGGLAFTNDTIIELRRLDENGIAQEAGKFHLRDGTYEITLQETTGSIEAQLLSSTGKILGRGLLRISDVNSSLIKSQQVDGISILIKPHVDGISGQVLSAYSFGDVEKPVEKAQVELDSLGWNEKTDSSGHFEFRDIANGSSVLIRAQSRGFLPTQQIVVAGSEAKFLAFPEKMISAFWDLVADLARKKGIKEGGNIIWGRVTIDSKPISGVVIESENAPGFKPIYFNKLLIPDPELKATSENGLFAFVNLEPGFHSLIAIKEGHYFSHGNILVEEGSIALANLLQSSKIDPVDVKVFDAIGGSPASAELVLQSLEEPHRVMTTGISKVFLPRVDRLSFLKAIPQEEGFEESFHVYLDSSQFLHVPLIRTEWLKNMKATAKIDDSADGGVIVGFVQNQEFDVYLAGHEDYRTDNIVYFDHLGQVYKGKFGVVGGGFILFNVPAGPNQVVVVAKKNNRVLTQITATDPQVVSVLQFKP